MCGDRPRRAVKRTSADGAEAIRWVVVRGRVAQLPARRCAIALTMGRHTRVLREREVDAVSRLPGLYIAPALVESGKAGTDGYRARPADDGHARRRVPAGWRRRA